MTQSLTTLNPVKHQLTQILTKIFPSYLWWYPVRCYAFFFFNLSHSWGFLLLPPAPKKKKKENDWDLTCTDQSYEKNSTETHSLRNCAVITLDNPQTLLSAVFKRGYFLRRKLFQWKLTVRFLSRVTGTLTHEQLNLLNVEVAAESS